MSVRKALAALAVGTLAIGTGAAVAGGGNSHDNAFGSFEEVESSVACTAGGNGDRQFILPDGFTQRVFAREGEAGTANNWDMNTQNETGRQKGRYLYRTHEVGAPSSVSVTDLRRNTTRVLAQRADWEVLDGIVWTPWGTLLVAEEVVTSRVKDPALPGAKGGHVYEINPTNGVARLRAAVGSRSHEGLRFDEEGNF